MSLKKIAETVGVSVSTVSRVLNNTSYKCASEDIKNKIWKAARELNYVPNLEARNLKKGKNTVSAYNISVLLSRFETLDADPFFQELFRNIEEEAFRQQCRINKILNLKTLLDNKLQDLSDCDGLIILGRCPENLIANLRPHCRSMIGIGRNPTDYEIDEIICNGFDAAATAMEYLISLGHRKIAYIGDCSSETRYIGYYEALLKYKIPLNYKYIYATNQTLEGGYQAMKDLLSSSQQPTAVFCANDITAIGVLKACEKLSRDNYLPSVISIDNISALQSIKPLLTTVNIPKDDMGKMAVKILLDRIQGKHSECIRLEFPSKLVIRDSCYVNTKS